MKRASLGIVALLLPLVGVASPLVADLQRQLDNSGPDYVNAHLRSNWSSMMAPLNNATASCDLQAVSLAVRLSRSTVVEATNAHIDAIRLAAGRCSRFVLALARPEEVAAYCASIDRWTPVQTARELRRRIAAIDSDKVLRSTVAGTSCRAAYKYELENTRVVLKKRA